MKITGRHMEVTPALKRYIRARFERLERYVSLDRLEIVLSVKSACSSFVPRGGSCMHGTSGASRSLSTLQRFTIRA